MSNWYRAGTVTLLNGESAVVGVGTLWLTQVFSGDLFTIDGSKFYEVNLVTDDTHMTLNGVFEEASAIGSIYSVIRNFTGTMQADVAAQLADLVLWHHQTLDDMTGWLRASVNNVNMVDALGVAHQVVTPYGLTSMVNDMAVAGSIPMTQKGAANGVASLDSGGKVPSDQLPAFVDDVIEYANRPAFPETGSTGSIYVALDTNICYRWGGSTYIKITSGAVDSVAGRTGIILLSKADVGLASVDNTSDASKPVSSATQVALDAKSNAGHTHSYIGSSGGDVSGLLNLASFTEKKLTPAVDVTTPINCGTGTCAFVVLTQNTAITLTGVPATLGSVYSIAIFLKQDGTGARYVTWPAGIVWQGSVTAPQLTSAANKTDIVSLSTPDNGTTWYGSIAKNY